MQGLRSAATGHRLGRNVVGFRQQVLRRASVVPAAKAKGFGAGGKQQAQWMAPQPEQQQAAPQPEQQAAAAEAPPVASGAPVAQPGREEEVEALLRRRKNQRVEPKVKVESAVVDMATGKTPTNAVGEAEARVVQVLAIFFTVLLTEGLLLAGSGFLPSDWDAFISDVLYPSYSPQMLLFLGMSSAYGLYKTGKLPGQQQLK